jgi:hypothetical protein
MTHTQNNPATTPPKLTHGTAGSGPDVLTSQACQDQPTMYLAMSASEKAALVAAKAMGRTVQVFCGDGWFPLPRSFEFKCGCSYRAAPTVEFMQ